MALMHVVFSYNANSDLLTVELPEVAAKVTCTAPILPFTEDAGVPPLSFVLFLGYDEEDSRFSGEITGFEMPFFWESYTSIRDAIDAQLRPVLPQPQFVQGRVAYDAGSVDLSKLDEDIRTDACNVILLSELMNLLDSFYVDIVRYRQAPESEQRSMEVEHTRATTDIRGRFTTGLAAV